MTPDHTPTCNQQAAEGSAQSNTYGAAIKRLRKMHDLKQSAFADAIGTTQSRLSRWETGKIKPSRRMLERINHFARNSKVFQDSLITS